MKYHLGESVCDEIEHTLLDDVHTTLFHQVLLNEEVGEMIWSMREDMFEKLCATMVFANEEERMTRPLPKNINM